MQIAQHLPHFVLQQRPLGISINPNLHVAGVSRRNDEVKGADDGRGRETLDNLTLPE